MKMEVTTGKNGSTLIKVSLTIVDKDTNEELTLTGEVEERSPINLISDAGASRSAAAVIVGRMITRWKMSIIDTIDSGMVEAVAAHLRSVVAGADGAPRDGGVTD